MYKPEYNRSVNDASRAKGRNNKFARRSAKIRRRTIEITVTISEEMQQYMEGLAQESGLSVADCAYDQ